MSAQSHRRLFRALVGVSACALASVAANTGRAQAPTPTVQSVSVSAPSTTLAELTALRGQLGAASLARRDAALLALLELEDSALPAIRARLSVLAAHYGDGKAVANKLPTLRRARALHPRASARDPVAGLLSALEQDASSPMQTAVELLALLRALERQHSLAASDVIVNQLFAIDPPLFQTELARTRKRLGKLLVPGYLRARARSADPRLQELARDGLVSLGLVTDAQIFGQREPALLAAVFDVAAEAPRSEDLPWLVASLDDPRPVVRDAARRATRARGADALDLLRARVTDLLGEEPDPAADASQLLEQATRRLDALDERADIQALARAEKALSQADLIGAERALDAALRQDPSASSRALAATTYLALADRYDGANRPAQALRAYRRALRLQPEGAAAKLARARVLYLEAEQRAAQGIADLQGLARAAQLEPTRPAAAQLLSELSGTRIDRDQDLRKQLGLVAAALLAVAALLVLWIRAINRREARLPRPIDATKSPSP